MKTRAYAFTTPIIQIAYPDLTGYGLVQVLHVSNYNLVTFLDYRTGIQATAPLMHLTDTITLNQMAHIAGVTRARILQVLDEQALKREYRLGRRLVITANTAYEIVTRHKKKRGRPSRIEKGG